LLDFLDYIKRKSIKSNGQIVEKIINMYHCKLIDYTKNKDIDENPVWLGFDDMIQRLMYIEDKEFIVKYKKRLKL
jgi:hypothetical protein